MKRTSRQTRMLGWWYVSIGGAFTLLALRSVIRGDSAWPIVFRLAIAAGFFVLGLGTMRGPAR